MLTGSCSRKLRVMLSVASLGVPLRGVVCRSIRDASSMDLEAPSIGRKPARRKASNPPPARPPDWGHRRHDRRPQAVLSLSLRPKPVVHTSQTLRVTGHPFLGLACARHRYEFEIDGEGRGNALVGNNMRAQAAPASGRDGRGILARLRTPTAPRESMTYTGTSMAHPHDISLRPRHGVAHILGKAAGAAPHCAAVSLRSQKPGSAAERAHAQASHPTLMLM